MIRIIFTLILTLSALFCHAENHALTLADNAPEKYVVVRGDTLWGISSRFLTDPWRWPEIWHLNQEQIRNPHRIYPGDVILLERDAEGNPRLRLLQDKLQPRIYSETVQQAIPAIPPHEIEPFISTPLIVDANALDSAARIVGTQQDRVFLGHGDIAYVENADPGKEQWQVYRNGKALLDPEDPSKILGYEAFYLGTASQVRVGQPATFEILSAKQEIGRGDRLLPAERPTLSEYLPHKPERMIDGRVIAVYGGVGSGGRGSIVSLNKGRADGLEIGHVLALARNRVLLERDAQDRPISITLPPERSGLLFVFRTFERISYALVVQAGSGLEVNDFVRTP